MSDAELGAAKFQALYDRLKNKARVGLADRRGALNCIFSRRAATASSSPVMAEWSRPVSPRAKLRTTA
jgi:hypothetical protein